MSARCRRVDLEQRDVGGRVAADQRRFQGVVVREAHLDRGRSVDDVEVGDDVPFVVEHEARAERLGGLLELAGVRGRRGDRGRDLNDAGTASLVDLVDRQRGARRGRNRARRRRPAATTVVVVESSRAPTAAAPPSAAAPPMHGGGEDRRRRTSGRRSNEVEPEGGVGVVGSMRPLYGPVREVVLTCG